MFVYIALDKLVNVIKVGISTEPHKRVQGLTLCQDVLDFELYYFKEFDKPTATILEKKLLGYLRFHYNNINLKFGGSTETFKIDDTSEYNKVVEFCKDYITNFAKQEDMDQEYFANKEKYRFDTIDKFVKYVQIGCNYCQTRFEDRVTMKTLKLIYESGTASDYTKYIRGESLDYSETTARNFFHSVVDSFPDGTEEHF